MKQLKLLTVRHMREPFRNCQVAAPLKLRHGRARGQGLAFPQLSSCGPIEAQTHFPIHPPRDRFPQLSSCGPIEARARKRSGCRAACSAFRNCQVAAPLKLLVPGTPRQHGKTFPQLSSCGPIEARAKSLTRKTGGAFPQLSSCGPIEATCPRTAGRSCATLFPQLSSCGPIEARKGSG